MSKRSFSILTVFALLLATTITVALPTLRAQEAVNTDAQRQIAERFMQVLLRRPSPGTALDRVYSYHVQNGTLTEMMNALQAEAEKGGEAAGARYMIVGLMQMRRGSDAEAAQSLAQAEELRSTDAMASYYHGKALLMAGRNDLAAETLERAIGRGPPRNEAMQVFHELGRLYQRREQPEQALSVWERLVDAFPGDLRVEEQIAQILAEEGQNEAALERYEKLIKQSTSSDNHQSIEYRIAAAELKRTLGRTEDAITDLESILDQLRPSSWLYADVQRRIEAGFLRGGDYAALADYYATKVKERPDEVELRMHLGQTLARAGRLTEAETALRETVELAPNDNTARIALVDVLALSGKTNEAARQLEVLVQRDPENPDFLIRLGNTWLDDLSLDKAQRQEAASIAWQQLADARQDDAVISAQVGDLMRGIGRTDQALSLYRRAIELAPAQPQYREYLGEYLHKLNRQQEALETWTSIAEGPRENRDNLIRLAEVLHTFERPQLALDAFASAAKLDPTFTQRMRYAELLAQAENYDESLGQISLAEQVAETPEERDQLLEARIGVYQLNDTISQRIAAARQQAEQTKHVGDYRRLSVMLDAASRPGEATEAIESAMQADPNDIPALATAAELYRKSARYSDAVDAFQTLAKREKRFLPNYLKRIASLQMQLGQTDDALATAQELVAAQPGNPESHRFYAEQLFRVGRDSEGIDRLRLAIRTAPRDDSVRRALAKALADRFRTDEAIEIYWQLLEDADDIAEQTAIIHSLAPLYERKGNFSRLVQQLERRGRENFDMRTAILLKSAAHHAANDFGNARKSLQPLLDQNPRDAELLHQMVSLSAGIGELDAALAYQQQLTSMADTDENRLRLFVLLVNSGQIDMAEASLQRLHVLDDPVTTAALIDRTYRRNDTDAAIRICRAALKRDDDLWEVRVRLAVYLCLGGELSEAIAEADRVDAMGLAPDTLSMQAKASAGGNPSLSPTMTLGDRRWERAQQAPLFAAFFTGAYLPALSARGQTDKILSVESYAHAQFLTLAIRLAAARKARLDSSLESSVDIPPLDAIDQLETRDQLETLWTTYNAAVMQRAFAAPMFSLGASSDADSLEQLAWRLAALDSDARVVIVHHLLSARNQIRSFGTGAGYLPEPLTDEQLQVVSQAYQESAGDGKSAHFNFLATSLHKELVAAGHDSKADLLRQQFDPASDDPETAIKSLNFHVQAGRIGELSKLAAEIRSRLPKWASTMNTDQRTELANALTRAMSLGELSMETSLLLADLAIASQALVLHHSTAGSHAAQQKGSASAYVNINGQRHISRVIVPLSSRLLPSSMAAQFFEHGGFLEDSHARVGLTEHLQQGPVVFQSDPKLFAAEQRLRFVLAGFARWWVDDVAGAYDTIVLATEKFPDDDSLWIERARLAAELDRPEASLEALEKVTSLDSETLRLREMAALSLAPRLGRTDRARTAAQRLFGMRLNKPAETALADQLTRLGMREMATAVLQRSQRRGGQSSKELLDLAQRYTKTGAMEAAGEIAFRTFHQLRGRTKSGDTRERTRAVGVLRTAGRLDALLERMEQRVAAAPKSLQLKTELAELYTAVGRRSDASKVFLQIAAQTPDDPQTLWRSGEQLYTAKRYEESIQKFVEAINKHPNLMSRNYSTFQRALTSARQSERSFLSLLSLDLNQLDGLSITRLAAIYRTSRTSNRSSTLFLNRLIEKTPVESMGDLLSVVQTNRALETATALPEALQRVFADERTYRPTSPFWKSGSPSSSGDLRGALQPCLHHVGRNPELEATVRHLISERVDGEKTGKIAQMLLLLLDVDTDSAEDIERRTNDLLASGGAEIPYQFWWQAGQVFEDDRRLRHVAITLFEHVRDHLPVAAYTSYIGTKLIDVYMDAGERQKARRELIRSYESLRRGVASNIAYPPGYQEYRDIQAKEKIAANLIKIDAPLDALRIYSDTLAEHRLFEAMKQYSRAKDVKSDFQSRFAATSKKLNNDHFERFLFYDRSEEVQRRKGIALDLMPLASSSKMSPEQSSIAAIAICGLSESASGHRKLDRFDQQAAKRLEGDPRDWSLLAMRCMIAVKLDHEEAAQRVGELTERVEEIAAEFQYAPAELLDLYSPVLVALSSNQPDVRRSAGKLADRIIAIAKRRERRELVLTLSVAKLDALASEIDRQNVDEQLRGLLDSLAPAAERQRTVPIAMAEQFVQIAELASRTGAWERAMDALRRGFAGGPPYRRLATTDFANPFAPPSRTSSSLAALLAARNSQSARSSNKEPEKDAVDRLLPRILAVLDQQQAAGSLPAGPDPDATYAALKAIVLPAARERKVFPYASKLLDQVSFRTAEAPDMNPPSVSAALTRAAVACGKADELAALLDSLRDQSSQPRDVDLVRAQLAFAMEDSESLSKALTDLAHDCGVSLREKDASDDEAEAPNANITEADCNTLLHAILPVHDRHGLTPLVAKIERVLLKAASQNRSIGEALELWIWLAKQLVHSEDVSNNDTNLIIELCLAVVRDRDSDRSRSAPPPPPPPSPRTTIANLQSRRLLNLRFDSLLSNIPRNKTNPRIDSASLELARAAILAKRNVIAGDLLREHVLRDRGLAPVSDFLPKVALDLLELDATSRYVILSQIVLRKTDQPPSIAALVSYVDPPRSFRSVLPRLDDVRKVSIGHRDFPITSVSLLLADAAANCGRTDELVDRLRPHIKQPGDETEAMVGQALLAGGRIDAAGQVLKRVDLALGETLPAEPVKSAMPIESALLVARCLSVDNLQAQAASTWKHLLTHARHRDIGLPMSMINRVAIKLGITHASGGRDGSPLQHWVSCQVPYPNMPVLGATEPKVIVRDGTLRFGGGADQSILMLKYPLAGNFSFSHRNVYHESGATHNTFGGTVYVSQASDPTLTVRTLDDRTSVRLSKQAAHPHADNRNAIELDGDSVRVKINGNVLTEDQRGDTMPFAGLFFSSDVIAEVNDIEIDGDPIVLREVKPIGPQLRGWSCPILGGYLPGAQLPRRATDSPRRASDNSFRAWLREQARAKSQSTWYVNNGELLSGDRDSTANSGSQRHIQYLRPLMQDESISYDFFYRSEIYEVHPSIGRVGVLLRADGVKLRWLAQTRSLESFEMEPLHEVEPDEILGDGRPELRDSDWNRVEMTSEGSHVVVAVNGKPICRCETSIDQRFGFLSEKKPDCRVRELTLTGPWPKTLPPILAPSHQ